MLVLLLLSLANVPRFEDWDLALQEGNRWLARRELDAAEDAFRQSSILNPSHYLPHLSLGAALVELGKFDEAETSYTAALAIKPRDFHAHFNMGIALARANKFARSISHFQVAVSETPSSFEARFSLAESFFRLALQQTELSSMHGRFADAKQHHEAALLVRPQNPQCLARLEKLAQLVSATSVPAIQSILSATESTAPPVPPSVKMDRRGVVKLKASGVDEQMNMLLKQADDVMHRQQSDPSEAMRLLNEVLHMC
jgi:tetratricopeptide (TPR) repeat protein